MNKYIGFDIDSKKIVACVVENGKKDIYQTLKSDIGSMRKFLEKQKSSGHRVELAFEISGQAGFIYDSLVNYVDEIKVANPSKMTWIYRTAKSKLLVKLSRALMNSSIEKKQGFSLTGLRWKMAMYFQS